MENIHDRDFVKDQKCEPCEGIAAPFEASEIKHWMRTLDDTWDIVDDHHLYRAFGFEDFEAALKFTNNVGALAEDEGHHPEIVLGWGKADISIWTHAVDGLTLNDFILASKISDIFGAMEKGHRPSGADSSG